MKKLLCVMAILALTTAASASVTFFFTSGADPAGLTVPANAFDPTKDNGTDVTDGEYAVTTFPTSIPGNLTLDAGQYAYIWLKFVNEPNAAHINGLKVALSAALETAYYVVDDTQGDTAAKRWDGAYTAPTDPEFKTNPQTLVGVTSTGVRNLSSTSTNWNLYKGGTYRMSLLGAVRGAAGTTTAFDIASMLCNYETAPNPTMVAGNSITWTPEPASMLLLGLVGLMIRRR